MKKFNTSGPNIPKKHYTIVRNELLVKGLDLIDDERYFNYKVAHINFESYKTGLYKTFISRLKRKLFEFWSIDFKGETLQEIFEQIEIINTQKFVLIIDEVEGINDEYFGDFLHSIRNAYHSRETHCLKSVILVGVSNIVGVVSDNAN